jgi:2,4-dienoyl-CoA reductase-like NADH-dependent reductase (Old Yellow Enzyme family)
VHRLHGTWPIVSNSSRGALNSTGTDVHEVGGIASRGPGVTFLEATAVLPEGRLSPEDLGLWSNEQIPAYKEIATFVHSQNQKIAIQLNHAGRKASTVAPWLSFGATAFEEAGGWPENVFGPSAIPHSDTFPHPKELSREGIQRIKQAFVDATIRSVKAGIDVIEIHAAHGYLLHQFMSPVSNMRTDEYGGSFENRTRLLLEVVDAIRAVIPEDMPLFVRYAPIPHICERSQL